MYSQFFGFSEKPFSIAPSPRYLYMSDRHSEAMLHLQYGLQNHGGFLLLTGEVGTGKTTLSRSLIEQLPETVDIAVILNPSLNEQELLKAICDEWQLGYQDGAGTQQLFEVLSAHLLHSYAKGRHSLLVIDEAQHLSAGVLEQLRLLTNLETEEKKLLQVILIGQPELQQKLREPELRQLAQRITARYHLLPLTLSETDAYIRYRLQVAGSLQPLFSRRTIRRVFSRSKGIPRLINLICDRALLSAFSRGRHQVTPQDVEAASAEVSGGTHKRWRLYLANALGALLLIALGAGGWLYLQPRLLPKPVVAKTALTQEQKQDFMRAVDEARLPQIGMQSLYRIWGYEASAEHASCANAKGAELECTQQSMSLEQLQRLKHPAVIRLYDSQGDKFYATLICMTDEKASLQIGNSSWQLSNKWLRSHWGGQATLLWRSPVPGVTLVKQGDRGAAVGWMEQRLASILKQPILHDASFDEPLRQQLMSFQRQRGLQADGVAGVNTLMALGSAPRQSMICQ
ncbi:ExeA family protein [Dongshaea marina]|uniref:ExeA family protein n=1 Tax=Dongshaea marina TaxID=2047966 RepID=UPI000D3E3843|nr:ExeA family protein [Dongshaea marina]